MDKRGIRSSSGGCCALACAGVSLLALLAAGCGLSQWVDNGFEVGPDYAGPPPAAVAEDWIDNDDSRVIPAPPEYPDWWSELRDPVLNELVDTAYRQNLTLREAGLRILQARAQRAIAVGNLAPQSQTIDGGFAHSQIGLASQPKVLPAPGFERHFDSWDLSGNLSWELDLWGRFRRAIEAADANLEASVFDYDAILVSLIAEVATAYVDIRTFELRLEYARQNARIQERSLALTQERFDAGKTDAISVRLSSSNLEATRAIIPPLEIGLRQANNRLCTLLGIPPADLEHVLGESGIPSAPAEVVVGIPADLLRRRPDVLAAERRVAAQSARIGIALSDLYPRIAVTGQISVEAEEFSNLFSSLAQGGSVGPSFQWNVLNYGRIINNARAEDAVFGQAVANYQNTVLTANQEVEDALVAFLQTQRRVDSLRKTVRETEAALELAVIRFREGEDNFTGVFILQGDLVAKQDQLAAAQGDVVTSLIAVYKALGGGWQIRCPEFQPRQLPPNPRPSLPDLEEMPTPAIKPDDDAEPEAAEPPAPADVLLQGFVE